MKIHLAFFLCLSVLLSGCMTANTCIFRPEPKSCGRITAQIYGGIGDAIIVCGIVYALRDEYSEFANHMTGTTEPEDFGESITRGAAIFGILGILTYVALAVPDILISSAIQTENQPDEEPSEEDKNGN